MLPTNIIHCPVTHTGGLGSDTQHFLVILGPLTSLSLGCPHLRNGALVQVN